MSDLRRYDDPFTQLHREINSLFQRRGGPWASGWGQRASAGVYPLVNIYDDGESFLVQARVPGVSKEALDVSVKDRQLTLRAERQISAPEGADFHRRERAGGRFSRVIELPAEVNADKVQASFKDGVLEVRLPRAESAKPRQITIR